VPAREPSSGIRERVRDEDREEDGDGGEPPLVLEAANEDQVAQAEADPAGTEHRARDGYGGGLPRLGDRREDEGEHEREEEAAEHPGDPGDLSAQERGEPPSVAREHEWAQRPGEAVELVQGDESGHRDEGDEEPPSQVGASEHDREPGRDDGDAREEGAHLPP